MLRSLNSNSHSLRSLLAARRADGAGAGSRGGVATVAVLVVLTALGAANGGYFPGSWGWAALVLLWLAGIALLLDEGAAIGRAGLALLGLLAALTAWTLLSVVWSSDVTQGVLEAQRDLVYVAGALAALLGARRSPQSLVIGTWGAIVLLAGYGLLTRLFPERIGGFDAISGNRLSQPIGYWNSLGLLAGMGSLLALGLTARSPSRLVRATAAASVVPLFATLYCTYSRGGWIATAVGVAVLFLVDRRRLQLLGVAAALAPWAAVGVLLASRKQALTHTGYTLAAASSDGHSLAIVLVLLTAAAALTGLGVAVAEPRVTAPRIVRVAAAASVALALLAAAIGVSLRYGSPVGAVTQAWGAFVGTTPSTGSDLNARLFHLSGSGRITQWKVAWKQVEARPLLGGGAGSFERYWNQHRSVAGKVRNAHNLYLEVLSTLGPLGLVLIVAALAVPLVVARRARGEPLATVALAAYAAFLLHAIVDWDWQITSVTLAALLCGIAVVLSATPRSGVAPLTRRGRLLTLAVVGVLAAAAVYGIAGRIALARVSDAARDGNWSRLQADASRASTLMPWSTEPWQRAGVAQLQSGRFEEARTSLRKGIASGSGNWQLWLDLARAADGRERASALDRAARLNPRSPEIAAFRQTLISISRLQGAK